MPQLRLDGSTEPDGLGDENDFWETPPWVVEALVPHLPNRGMPWNVYDPGCGRGALVTVAFFHLEIVEVHGFELHAGRAQECRLAWARSFGNRAQACVDVCDFLVTDRPCIPSRAQHCVDRSAQRLVLMNPPYSKPRKTIGREFVSRAIELAAPHGVVAALLPLAFAETPGRKELIHDRYKSRLRVLSERPDFGGEFNSGSLAYAWFIWDLLNPVDDWAPI